MSNLLQLNWTRWNWVHLENEGSILINAVQGLRDATSVPQEEGTRVQRLVHKQLRLTTRYLVISAASKSRLFCSPVSLSMRLPMELVSCVASFANRNATPKLHASYTARPIFIVYNLSSRCDNSSSNTRASHYSRTYLHLRFKI